MRVKSLVIVLLLLFSVIVPIVNANPVVTDEFELFQKNVILHPGLNESTSIPHNGGYRVDSASFDWELSPERIDETWTIDMATYSTIIGNATNLTSTSNGLILNQSTIGPSTAGTSQLHLFNNSNLQGFHAYDTLQLSCGIVSCGSITATGDLTIHANEVIIDASTYISGSDSINSYLGDGGSESTTNNWLGDGAGGAGHVGAGGDGGGSSTNGGLSYGNGSESGSAGGDNSHPNGASTLGGLGGAVITIVAGSITIDGSVTSEGGVGDNGPLTTGGNGGNAAGGGSGGSIILKADTISIGSSGIVSSAGGDGGDGEDAVWPSGPSLFLYHGGDGGGGGSGGFITMTTLSNGLTNSGTVDVSAGAGGDYGLKLGSGSDGVAGSNSAVGNTTYSTFSGFISSGNNSSSYGSFLISGLGDDEIVEMGWLNTTASVPAGAVLDMKYNYTLNGVDWSGWLEGNLSHQELPRFTDISFLYDFERSSAGASPTLIAITPGSTYIDHMENLSIELEGQTILDPLVHQMPIGWLEEGESSPTATGIDLWVDVPLNGTAVSDFVMWMDVEPGFTGNITGTFDSGHTISWSSADVVAGGIDLIIPMSVIQNEWPTVYNSTSEGIDWAVSNFSLSLSNLSAFTISNLSFHHTIAGSLEFASEMEAHAISQCGSWYDAIESCLDEYSIDVKGDSTEELTWNQILELSNLNIVWSDDIEPQIESVFHKVDGVNDVDARNGDNIVVIVRDKIGEDGLQGEIWWHSSPVSDASELVNATSNWLNWNSQLQVYLVSISTTELDPSIENSLWFSIELTDAQGNSVIQLNADSITVFPAIPSVSNLVIMTVDGEPTNNGGFNTPDHILFMVTDASNRSDLEVEIELASSSSTQNIELNWSENDYAYTAVWEPEFADIGIWDVEVLAGEPNNGEADTNGLQNGNDASFTIGDGVAPIIISATSLETSDEVRIDVEWETETGDPVSVWAFIFGPNGEYIGTELIEQTSEENGFVILDKELLTPGAYSAEIHVKDNSLNEVNTTIFLVDIPVPIPIIDSANLSLTLDGENLLLSGDVTFRSGEGTIKWLINDELWLEVPIPNGSLSEIITLSNLSNSSHNITLEICSLSECENMTYNVNATPWWHVVIIAFCSEANCSLINVGENPTTVRIISSKPSSDFNCSVALISPGLTSDITCQLKDEMAAGEYLLDWRLEAQNRGGLWLVLKEGSHNFTISESELEQEPESNDDAEQLSDKSESIFTTLNLSLMGGVILIIAGILFFLSRNDEEEEFSDNATAAFSEELIETDSLIAAEPLTEPNQIAESLTVVVDNSKFIGSWKELPGGGQYHQRDNGTWYETPSGDWWWQHPDGRFERV